MDDFALQKVAEFVAVPACSRIRDEDRCRYAGAGAGRWRGCALILSCVELLADLRLCELRLELELPLARFRLGGEAAISDANGRR